ncbi:MAG: AAA family ATPase [Coriobacteriia bacterium]|nr:AAA family ATPase [Coriobacteriia bacterium]
MADKTSIIGRTAEKEILYECFGSAKSEFVAVYGRRRIGKTYLVREALGDEFVFYATGVLDGNNAVQLANYNEEINNFGGSSLTPASNWREAFNNLHSLILSTKKKGKKVIFLDEIPWMCAPRSGFLSELDHFWNRWASQRKDVMLIICGSAASWIIDNVIDNTGGLHNRVTRHINLSQFTLGECEQYYRSKGIEMPLYQVAEAYMVFGGIPYYMDLFRPKLSLAQNVDAIFFAENAPLANEYQNLFRSLYRNADNHIRVIENLAARNFGKTRDEIAASSGLSGGGLTKTLKELIACGFVREYLAYGKKTRDKTYQLVDPFTLFCLRFGSKRNTQSNDFWLRSYSSPAHSAWAGYAFELVCLLHLQQIHQVLGISGVLTQVYAWRSTMSDPGIQIDLVIDRADNIINLCEIKYSSTPFRITKEYDAKLRNKKAAFIEETKTRKAVHTTMITTYGLNEGIYQAGIPFSIVLDDLF